MKTWQLNKTHITINPENTPDGAYVEPATRAQINALGNVVIGEAWMTSQPYQKGPTVIKFAPPQPSASSSPTEALALWGKCYRKIIMIAEREELASLTLPLPGATPHIPCHAQEESNASQWAVSALCDQLRQAKRLRQLSVYATDENDTLALFKMFS
ncbi:hypothetical protein ELY33_16595 [Vreelandella andesensis]|uniref:Uncharacterized protein n=1 Tax=Vreelandella andesensis TaxID=447567 RepID=A0A433KEM9_9GAMM|nr:hypothetical protein [Halomonas andesensis]RUR26728.1 hypothetical protein ELY33_16595 [Halomonas andesensis]